MVAERSLEVLRKALRGKLREAAADVSIAASDLRTVLDELGRLQQSNERLRRQNRRVRLKLQRAGLADDAEDGAATAADEPEGDV